MEFPVRFKRPFRAEIVGETDIWIIDADGALVTPFPRLTDSLAADFARASLIALADVGDEALIDRVDGAGPCTGTDR
jgi:hypothetical protein